MTLVLAHREGASTCDISQAKREYVGLSFVFVENVLVYFGRMDANKKIRNLSNIEAGSTL